METPHLPNDALTYRDEVRATHRSLWRAGIASDFVRPGADAARYRVLFVPTLYSVSHETAEWLRSYVLAGGTLVVSYLSGIADEHLRIIPGGYPGALRGLLGIRSEEIEVLSPGETVELSGGLMGTEWSERIHLEGAESLHDYVGGPLARTPAVTLHQVGTGSAVYVSTRFDQASRDRFVADLVEREGIEPTVLGAIEAGVEAIRRRGVRDDYVFLLHHGDKRVNVRANGIELLSAANASEGIEIEAGGVAVVRVAPGTPITLSKAGEE